MFIIFTVLIYFLLLFALSQLTTKSGGNDSFFRGAKRSPWYMVAFGMIGASISGVTFVSVPGMVMQIDMTYLQTCIGFIAGYFAVAFILLPIYYRHNLTSIYTFLGQRMGERSHQTASWFFLLSKMTGAALRFYVPCFILQRFVLQPLGIPFAATVICMVLLIWLYTRRGGIRTLVWTDSFQTFCMLVALLLIIYNVAGSLGMGIMDAAEAIACNEQSRMFVFDDWFTTQNFWKQFVSGIFIVIVMTGLDQDMMQKNLTCKSLRDAQKDMCTYGLAFVPVNLLFLSLGILLTLLASQNGVPLPADGDQLLPMFAATGKLGPMVQILFTIGIIAASFSSADSALTSMTTCYCIDIRKDDGNEKARRRAHITVSLVFAVFIILIDSLNSTSIIDAVYTLCSYTYGPLLGMFAFSILCRRKVCDMHVPYIALAAPLACFIVNKATMYFTGYQFGYELLLLNGLIVFLVLLTDSTKQESHKQ